MAGGGFASHAMNVIKANRALLNRRKRLSRADYLNSSSSTPLKTKITTPGQMRAVRLQIAANQRNDIKIWIISICVAVILIVGLYFSLTD